jgi:hypothetical protein
MNSIRNLENWAVETTTENRRLGELKMQAGHAIVDALESYYAQWQHKHTDRVRTEYMKWRVRLHRKWNDHPEFLEELNEAFDIGLDDTTIGKTLWDIPAEDSVNLSNGYNWRRDSGYALRGGSRRTGRPDPEDLVQ